MTEKQKIEKRKTEKQKTEKQEGQSRANQAHARHRAGERGNRKPADPRVVAFDILTDVLHEDAYANLLTPRIVAASGMNARDRAFATDLVYGTLRWMRLLDAIVSAAAKRDLTAIDKGSLTALRLGAYQSLFLGVADHAAVSCTVALAKKRVGAHAGGFVNAVMHRIVSRGRKEWESIVVSRIPKADRLRRLGVRYSHPDWVVRELEQSWKASGYADASAAPSEGGDQTGNDGADNGLERMLERDNEPPVVTLVARPGLITLDDLRGQLPDDASCEPGLWSPYALRVRGVAPQTLAAVRAHTAGVEDEGSQLAALVLAAAPLDPTGSKHVSDDAASDNTASNDGASNDGATGTDTRWLDMCAGPGGKTALLASLAAQRGATVTANEPSHHRAELVCENVSAISAGIDQVTERDGCEFGTAMPGAFDRVLVDAPCSGLGALRRRPEARWRKQSDDIAELAQVQVRLLESALQAVRPGGVVAYVTCSPVLDETVRVVDAVLARHGEGAQGEGTGVRAERCDARAVLAGVVREGVRIPVPQGGGDVQLFEHVHDTDQMFISLLRRL